MFKKGQILKIVDFHMLHLPFPTIFEKGDLFEALEDSDGIGLRVKHLRTGAEGWFAERRFVKAPFQIGDRVIGVKNIEGGYHLIEDVKGTVVDVTPYIRYSDQVYGVRFDKDVKGYTLGGLCKYGYGLWCAEDEIKAIPKEQHQHEVYEYQPGDRAGLDLMPIKVIYNDPATIFFYKDPISGKPTKSVAKCHPNDTYDKDKGRRVAVLKALHKEIPRIIAHETTRR